MSLTREIDTKISEVLQFLPLSGTLGLLSPGFFNHLNIFLAEYLIPLTAGAPKAVSATRYSVKKVFGLW